MRIAVFLLLIACSIGLFYSAGGAKYLNIADLHTLLLDWRENSADQLLLYGAATALIYIGLMSTPLPITAASTLSAGYLFGFWPGLVVIAIASLLAASLTFLACRYVFADLVKRRTKGRLQGLMKELEEAGIWYSLSLRLSAVVPFFILNSIQAITPIKLRDFIVATALGMIPVTLVLVNAGTRLADVRQLSDVLDWKIIASFILIALLPIILRRVMASSNAGAQ